MAVAASLADVSGFNSLGCSCIQRSQRGRPPRLSRGTLSNARTRVTASTNEEPFSLREKARKLDLLFYSSSNEGAADSPEQAADARTTDVPSDFIRDLPLWRVQWSMLPGLQEVLHVHVPHYCHMFEGVLAGPKPWVFGHLWLPGGSANLGDPAYALQPGSKAAMVGVLMQVSHAARLADGRLMLVARGVQRFQVVEVLQAVPYSRADVRLLPDKEELQAVQAAAAAAAPPGALPREECVATAAAAAVKVWLTWELGCVEGRVMDIKRQQDADELARVMSDVGSDEVAPYPDFREEGVGEDLQRIGRAASAAMHEELMRAQGAEGNRADEAVGRGDAEAAALGANGRALEPAGPVPAGADSEAGDCMAELFELEALAWGELDALCMLAQRVNNAPLPALLHNLTSLRPPVGTGVFGEVPSDDEEREATPQAVDRTPPGASYDDVDSQLLLRRVQRLSYALTALAPSQNNQMDRQVVLEERSMVRRLTAMCEELRQQRGVLAAVAALKGLVDE